MGVAYPSEPSGRQGQRHGDLLAEQGGRKVDVAHVAQHSGPEKHVVEHPDTSSERFFVFRGTVDVVEDTARQISFGHEPQIIDVRGPLQFASDRIGRERAEFHRAAKVLQHGPNLPTHRSGQHLGYSN